MPSADLPQLQSLANASRPSPAVPSKIRVLLACSGWPSGLIDVGSWAHHQGLADVAIVQAENAEQLKRKLLAFRPHVVGFRLEGGDLDEVRAFIQAVRTCCEAEVVLGGPTATSHPREVLDDLDADYVFAGEAEETFAQFLRLARRPNGRDRLPEIPGVAYQYGGRTWHNTLPEDGYGRTAIDADDPPRGALLHRLRHLNRPIASAEVLAANRLQWSLLGGFDREFESLYFVGGRGCPGQCTFCAKMHGQEVRVKSARQLLEEIEAVDALVASGAIRVARYPLFAHTCRSDLQPQQVAWAAVYDEDFFLHRRRAVEFFELWDQSPLKHRYRLGFQTNPCTLLDAHGRPHGELFQWIDRLKPMVQVGAESFHPALLERWQKRHRVNQLHAALAALAETGQDYSVFILLSDFDTTADELVETLRLLLLAAMKYRRMRIASSPFTIPLYDSQTRRLLEHRGLLTPERIQHFTDYERPQPGWMEPLAADLADLADAELHYALVPEYRDAALVRAAEAVCERLDAEHQARADARIERLLAASRRMVAEVREAYFQAFDP